MRNKPTSRRQFLVDTLKLVGASATAGLLPESILRAQSIPADSTTGTIADVKHIVILMQENRTFDQYLGTMAGARGFGDPRPVNLPTGYPVWYQPALAGSKDPYVLPFRPSLQSGASNTNVYYKGCDHSWSSQHKKWNKGQYDAWVTGEKSTRSMAFFSDQDIPFYSALARAFTICDAYHCSMIGPTDPNRLYLWTGCCGNIPLSLPITNNSLAPKLCNWSTLPERLNREKVSWKCYQDKGNGLDEANKFGDNGALWYSNYGDNALVYFNQYQGRDKADDPLAPAFNGTKISGNNSFADPGLFEQIRNDVKNDSLPQVSWIIAPNAFSEHPAWAAGGGEWYVSNILDALTSNPKVWAGTAFFICYDENDGGFDHVPPPVPPALNLGRSNVDTSNEFLATDNSASEGTCNGDVQIGLGARVPMFVISPWSTGGKVNSEVFDHTSIIRFIEKRFGVEEENISPWRRAVCGDLTSAFDFSQGSQVVPPFSIPDMTAEEKTKHADIVQVPQPPSPQTMPTQSMASSISTGQKSSACKLPYEFFVTGSLDISGQKFNLTFTNSGAAAVSLQVRSAGNAAPLPRHYTIGAPQLCSSQASSAASVSDSFPLTATNYDLSVYGPNGSLMEFRGGSAASVAMAEIQICCDVQGGDIRITLDNSKGKQTATFQLTDNAYQMNSFVTSEVDAGKTFDVIWKGSSGWYDVGVRLVEDAAYFRRAAGCVQTITGPWFTDPAIGNTKLFVPTFAIQSTTPGVLRFDYVTPPWKHSPKNWIGVYPKGPTLKGWSKAFVTADKAVGSVTLSVSDYPALVPGEYGVWYLFDNGYTPLFGPVSLTI